MIKLSYFKLYMTNYWLLASCEFINLIIFNLESYSANIFFICYSIINGVSYIWTVSIFLHCKATIIFNSVWSYNTLAHKCNSVIWTRISRNLYTLRFIIVFCNASHLTRVNKYLHNWSWKICVQWSYKYDNLLLSRYSL